MVRNYCIQSLRIGCEKKMMRKSNIIALHDQAKILYFVTVNTISYPHFFDRISFQSNLVLVFL
jgi:hypothetical protein